MKWLSDALVVAGCACIVCGCGLWSVALGFIVAGLLLVGCGAGLAWLRAGQKLKAPARVS